MFHLFHHIIEFRVEVWDKTSMIIQNNIHLTKTNTLFIIIIIRKCRKALKIKHKLVTQHYPINPNLSPTSFLNLNNCIKLKTSQEMSCVLCLPMKNPTQEVQVDR